MALTPVKAAHAQAKPRSNVGSCRIIIAVLSLVFWFAESWSQRVSVTEIAVDGVQDSHRDQICLYPLYRHLALPLTKSYSKLFCPAKRWKDVARHRTRRIRLWISDNIDDNRIHPLSQRCQREGNVEPGPTSHGATMHAVSSHRSTSVVSPRQYMRSNREAGSNYRLRSRYSPLTPDWDLGK